MFRTQNTINWVRFLAITNLSDLFIELNIFVRDNSIWQNIPSANFHRFPGHIDFFLENGTRRACCTSKFILITSRHIDTTINEVTRVVNSSGMTTHNSLPSVKRWSIPPKFGFSCCWQLCSSQPMRECTRRLRCDSYLLDNHHLAGLYSRWCSEMVAVAALSSSSVALW